MKPTLCVCSSHYGVDRDTNKFNIIGILEDIQSPAFPAFIDRIVFHLFVDKEAGDSKNPIGVLEVDLDGQRLARAGMKFDFQGKQRLRHAVDIQGVVIPGPGSLTFTAKVITAKRARHLASWTINVIQTGQMMIRPQVLQLQKPRKKKKRKK